jgi:hypothetical protein
VYATAHIVHAAIITILEIRTGCEFALAVSATNGCQRPRDSFVETDCLVDVLDNLCHLPHFLSRVVVDRRLAGSTSTKAALDAHITSFGDYQSGITRWTQILLHIRMLQDGRY